MTEAGERASDTGERTTHAGDIPGPHYRRAELILLIITAAWGLTFPLTKEALADASPLAFVALRFAVATALLAPFLRGRLAIRDRRAARAGILLGAIFALGFALQAAGLRLTTAAKSGFLTGTNVLFVPIFSWIWEGRRPPVSGIAGSLLAAAGIAFLTQPEDVRLNRGDLMTLGCAVVFGLEVVALQVWSRRHGSWPLMWPAIATTAVLCGLCSLLEPPRIEWTPGLWRGLAFTSVAGTAGALLLHMHWQKETTAVRAGVIYTSEPLFVFLFAAVLLGERLPAASLAGGAAIVAGMLIAIVGKPRLRITRVKRNASGAEAGS